MSEVWDSFLRDTAAVIGDLNPTTFDYSCNISVRHRYLYYETPKVACSTIKLTLQRCELEDPVFNRADFEELHLREFSPLLRPTQVGSLRRLLESGEYFKFCFVRNPFTRLLSCYLDKIAGNRKQKRRILRQLGRPETDLAAAVGFDEFADAIAMQPAPQMDPHWSIQWFHLAEGRLKFDMIGRFEAFDADFAAVAARASLDLDRYYSRERRHETRATQHLGQHYDARLTELVRTIYAADFRHFGYSGDLPL